MHRSISASLVGQVSSENRPDSLHSFFHMWQGTRQIMYQPIRSKFISHSTTVCADICLYRPPAKGSLLAILSRAIGMLSYPRSSSILGTFCTKGGQFALGRRGALCPRARCVGGHSARGDTGITNLCRDVWSRLERCDNQKKSWKRIRKFSQVISYSSSQFGETENYSLGQVDNLERLRTVKLLEQLFSSILYPRIHILWPQMPSLKKNACTVALHLVFWPSNFWLLTVLKQIRTVHWKASEWG